MAFALVGVLAWILAVGRYRWRIWCAAALSFLLVIFLCTVLDYWFYGKFVIAPFNYYYMNIVMHVAAAFGVSPWYTYFLQLGVIPSLALGVPIVLSVCIGTFSQGKNPIVWAFWSFLLFHSTISHKEPRFLFPLMPLLPLFMIWTYEMIQQKQNRFFSIIVIGLLTLVNVGGLFHVIFKPAGYGNVVMMQYLCERANGQEKLKIKAPLGSNPFRTGPLIARFYLWKPMNIDECNDSVNDVDLVVLWRDDEKNRKYYLENGYRETFSSMPRWQNVLNRFYKTYDSNMVLIAYEKK